MSANLGLFGLAPLDGFPVLATIRIPLLREGIERRHSGEDLVVGSARLAVGAGAVGRPARVAQLAPGLTGAPTRGPR